MMELQALSSTNLSPTLWLAIKDRSYRDFALHGADLAALLVLTAFLYSYVQFFVLPPKKGPGYDEFFISPQAVDGLVKGTRQKQEATRDICTRLKQTNKDVVIFWGSQSGNAERLAKQLARELQLTHGIAAVAEDLSAYDHQNLTRLPSNAVAGFIVSTFGEGDPPDNAAELYECLSQWQACETTRTEPPLGQLQYFAFGLGSSKYEYYNRFVEIVDESLAGAGATRLGYVGKQDETVRSDTSWTEWKESIGKELSMIVPKRASTTKRSLYDPDIRLVTVSTAKGFTKKIPAQASEQLALLSTDRIQPHSVGVSTTRLLSSPTGISSKASRTYLHIEFNIGSVKSNLSYKTGDHVAIWTQNSTEEVLRLGRLFGWGEEELHTSIKIQPLSETFDLTSFPSGITSRYALLRYYLDISGPVTQEVGRLLAHFAPTEAAKDTIATLLARHETWNDRVIARHLTLGKLMELVEPQRNIVWPADLFLLLLLTVPRLQPRYFSIASSPSVSPEKLAITVGVVMTDLPQGEHFYGLATNHLHALHQNKSIVAAPSSTVGGSQPEMKVCMHIRPSNFKLPTNISQPVLMIAAGSGIAPFLAFAQEREALYKAGRPVGQMVLVFGCRSAEQDYLYAEDWARLQQHDFFRVYTAFSRSGPRKRYVQHVIEEGGREIQNMIVEGEAACYICGSTGMATEVKKSIARVLTDSTRTQEEAQVYVDQMKGSGRLQEDVWA